MVRNRMSLAAMLGLVFVCSLGLAAMRSPTVVWTTAATTVALGLLLTGVLVPCSSAGRTVGSGRGSRSLAGSIWCWSTGPGSASRSAMT